MIIFEESFCFVFRITFAAPGTVLLSCSSSHKKEKSLTTDFYSETSEVFPIRRQTKSDIPRAVFRAKVVFSRAVHARRGRHVHVEQCSHKGSALGATIIGL